MRRYRTEIVIPPDRYVGVQLPAHLPEGRAVITIEVQEAESAMSAAWTETDPDHQDIEWFEEFDDPEGDEQSDVRSRSTW